MKNIVTHNILAHKELWKYCPVILLQSRFISTIRDPLYERFVSEWTKYEDEVWLKGPDLTPAQRKKQRQLAKNIVQRLAKEEGVDS